MIRPADWKPIGVDTLEKAALAAVTAPGSALVVAGPGTGKTELLGQRASFLLQTGRCPPPRRILAISFKRDAATNLRDRVERRSGVADGRRLDSMTFDAFAKQLLDRFWRALPPRWALSAPYRIAGLEPPRNGFGHFQLMVAAHLADRTHAVGWAAAQCGATPTAAQVHGVSFDDFGQGVQSLRLEPFEVPTVEAFLQLVALRRSLEANPPALSFQQIGCLATAIVAANPQIQAALRATYSHVFLDEFQDTTSIQYGLVRTIFVGSDCVLTAVGDAKQRIMGWAGAQRNVFEAFEVDFLGSPGALGRRSLTYNYRSNERIVAVLNILKRRIAPDEPDFLAARRAPDLPDVDIFSLLVAQNESSEADAVARTVAKTIADGTDARAIGLLVRQRADIWEERLKAGFAEHGVVIRNEDRKVEGASIQDLMTEDYSRSMLDLLAFCTRRHGGMLWAAAMTRFAAIEGIEIDDDESAERALAGRLDAFHQSHRIDPAVRPSQADVRAWFTSVEAALGIERLRGLAPQYAVGDLFGTIRNATVAFLVECAGATASWQAAIDRYRGQGQVPLLTITKSKGLEYDLVVVLGLNDGDWWSFQQDTEAGHSHFFVAASRARERLLLTRLQSDGKSRIEEIFGLLTQAGVTERST
jgi:superfamily I DNA/RNA helicase